MAAAPAPQACDPFEGPQADLDSTLDDILAGFDLPPPVAAPEAPRWPVLVRPHGAAMRNGNEPLVLLRELTDLGGRIEACEIEDVPTLDALAPVVGYLGWRVSISASVSEADVRDVFDFVGDACAIALGDGARMPAILAGPKPRAAAPAPAEPVVQLPHLSSKPRLPKPMFRPPHRLPASRSASTSPSSTG